jgi:hypothetical protein
MKIQINHFSQYNSEIPESEQQKSCGICCVKMLLDYMFPDNIHRIDDLIKEGLLVRAFDQNLGGGLWTHVGLVKILRNHGLLAYPQEFKSVFVDLQNGLFSENKNQIIFIDEGIAKIKAKLDQKKPTIASVGPGFNLNKDDHMIIINGYNKSSNETFYITDPQDNSLEIVSLETFLKHWKKLTIFVD